MSESELSDISSELIHSKLCDTIESITKSKDYTFTVESASKAGTTNFIGIIYRVYFNKTGEAKDEPGSLIVKTAPQNVARRDNFHSRTCFVREIYMYDELLPTFRAFELSKGLKEEDCFTEYPKCYRTIDVEFDECLILEDLCIRKLSPINKNTENLTGDHVRLYLKALAKYHAISMAFKDQQPDKFRKLTSNLTNDVFFQNDNEGIRLYFNQQAEYVVNLFSTDEYPHLVAKLKNLFVKDALDICIDNILSEVNDSSAVVSYGDANFNNTLFRNDDMKIPVEISLVDWQSPRLASPVTDIIYFIFCCVTKEVRDKSYDNLIQEYHERLSNHIRRLGSDPEKLFPFKSLLDQFQRYGKFGVILSFMVLPILTSEPDKNINLDEVADGLADGNGDLSEFNGKSKKFDERMRDVVIDMSRLGYI